MKQVVIELDGLTPFSCSRPVEYTKARGESWDEAESKIWREKAHFDENGMAIIPGNFFFNALTGQASSENEKIKGKGQQTYAGLFKRGIAASSDLSLGVKKADMKSITLPCNALGKKTGGSMVNRTFPIFIKWGGPLTLRIFDDNIPQDVFERYFANSGLLQGVGRGRPAMGCAAGNGRYRPTKFKWSDI